MQITVSVKGDLVPKGMQDLTAETPMIGRQQIRTVMERIKRRMQEYPPEPEGQSVSESHSVLGRIFRPAKGRYERTGRLGRSWAILRTEDDNGYRLENNARYKGKRYPRFVVGGADGTGQAWMHKGRWPLVRDVTDEETAKLPDEIEEKIRMVARAEGVTTQEQ
jgi:hypothetical protein